jgi:ATP-dependent Clp protease adaptor protein ClpS
MENVKTATLPTEEVDTVQKLLPPYHVIIENDDHHGFEFVVGVLRKVLCCTQQRALELTIKAHTSGRAVIWTGSKEVAEHKMDQVHSCHETKGSKKLGPVGCYIEPAA